MTAIILQFPRHRCRLYRQRPPGRCPFNTVRVLRGDREWNEWWTIAGSFGWLHGSWRDAVNEAVELAADYGLPISLDQ